MYHLYADDTQIYISGHIENIAKMMDTVSKCIEEVKLWMNTNKLKLNDAKTDVIIFTREKVNTSMINTLLILLLSNIKLLDTDLFLQNQKCGTLCPSGTIFAVFQSGGT